MHYMINSGVVILGNIYDNNIYALFIGIQNKLWNTSFAQTKHPTVELKMGRCIIIINDIGVYLEIYFA